MSLIRSTVEPARALPGAIVSIHSIHGRRLPQPADGPPGVFVGDRPAHVISSSTRAIRIVIPEMAEPGVWTVRLDADADPIGTVEIARPITTGVHQVDSPVFDRAGRLYVTHSGSRDTKVPVPLYRVGVDGGREPLAVDIANPTSLAIGLDGLVYVSSRFDGQVYRLMADDRAERYASELGVPTGLAFAPDGTLFVGDRSGTVLAISPDRHVETFATIPSSVAAFHLAYGPDDCLYVTAPTLATHDGIYRVTRGGAVTLTQDRFGRPQGLAFGADGLLYVVDALAGAAGLYRVDVSKPEQPPELVLTGPSLIGVAFDPDGRMAIASSDTIWRLGD